MFHDKLYMCNYWITYRCNSKCEYCNIWRDDKFHNIPDANFEDVKKNLEDLKKMGIKFIDFTGGEPLLNDELPVILSYAKKLGFFIKLSTNGFLYPEIAKVLKDKISRIYFSFDTTSKDEYKRIRGIDGFDKIIESINIAKSYYQDICLLYTATNENIKNISSLIKFAQEKKTILYIHPCFSYFNNEPFKKENIDIIKKYFWQPYVILNLPQLDFYKKGGNSLFKPSCKVGSSIIDITPDNCFTIPCFHHQIKKVKINNNLFTIFNSERWNELFSNVGKYRFCKNCTIDCYFGMSSYNRYNKYFLKQNLTTLKILIETHRTN